MLQENAREYVSERCRQRTLMSHSSKRTAGDPISHLLAFVLSIVRLEELRISYRQMLNQCYLVSLEDSVCSENSEQKRKQMN